MTLQKSIKSSCFDLNILLFFWTLWRRWKNCQKKWYHFPHWSKQHFMKNFEFTSHRCICIMRASKWVAKNSVFESSRWWIYSNKKTLFLLIKSHKSQVFELGSLNLGQISKKASFNCIKKKKKKSTVLVLSLYSLEFASVLVSAASDYALVHAVISLIVVSASACVRGCTGIK